MGVTQDLVNYGKVIRGWMGLEVQTVFTPGTQRQSLRVTGIHPRGPAAKAGINEGDIITHIDMQPVMDGRATMHQIALLRPGDAVEINLRRKEQNMVLQVIVGVRPEPRR